VEKGIGIYPNNDSSYGFLYGESSPTVKFFGLLHKKDTQNKFV
jgi:hypothetical protein